MDRDLTDLTPDETDEIMKQWEVLRQRVVDCWEAIAEVMFPVMQNVMNQIVALIVWVRREQLYWSLTRWRVPDRPARWVADKWPERWLPELRFEQSSMLRLK